MRRPVFGEYDAHITNDGELVFPEVILKNLTDCVKLVVKEETVEIWSAVD